ncbi:MAG TPA: hypothetical protein VGL89_02845 [Candidatus Koribacter sp.]|jgi:hypothetical protein
MQKHEHFEELCSLAIIGELSLQESAEFMSHLRVCAECQASFLELNEIASEQLPLAVGHSGSIGRSSLKNVREGALQRLVAVGLRITPEAVQGPVTMWSRAARRLEDLRWTLFAHKAQVAISFSLVALVVCAAVAVRYDRANRRQIELLRAQVANSREVVVKTELPQPTTAVVPDTAATDRLERQLADAGDRIAHLQMEKDVDATAINLLQANLDRVMQEKASLAEHANQSGSEATALRTQIDQLQTRSNNAEAGLVAAQYQVASLTNQLKTEQAAIDHERELLTAGRDIRDVMGARNLHIIDVHDMDARGEARPFGRIFLTEGKRLIFYAYDLNSPKMKDAAFQAWGQRAGESKAAVNLGVLYMDDQKQARWALKVEDPNLLSAIDSLFVTVEPQGGMAKPTGKKLMYAYLHNPINHP